MLKTKTVFISGILFLLWSGSGCGVFSGIDEVTEIVPTVEEPAVATEEPTPTRQLEVTAVPFNPESTSIPTLTQAYFPELGLSLEHPQTWLTQEGDGFVVLLSSQAVLDEGRGALLEITPLLRSQFDPYSRAKSPEDLIRMELERWLFLSPSNKIEVVQRAETVHLDDLEVATVIINLKETSFPPGREVIPAKDEFEIQTAYRVPFQSGSLQTVRVWIAVVSIEQKVVLFYGASPLEMEELFQAEFEAIVQSIVLTEPSTDSIEG